MPGRGRRGRRSRSSSVTRHARGEIGTYKSSAAMDKDQLALNLNTEAIDYWKFGRRNNLWDVGLTMMSIVGSIAGAVVSASGKAPLLAALWASLPAACTSYQRIVQLRERAFLHFEYAAEVEALELKVKTDPTPDLEELGKEWGDLIKERERRWTDTLRTPRGAMKGSRRKSRSS